MDPQPHENLAALIGRLAALIDRQLSPGDVAALRRSRPDSIDAPAFWRIAAVDLADWLEHDEPRRDEGERRWAVILQAMAELRGLHNPRRSLGAALADTEVAEHRVLRLLRASAEGLFDAVRIIAHHLATKGVSFNCADLAWLVLSDGRSDEEPVRRRIARNYYATQSSKEARTAS
jgi:CRISPR system Cascade subunit CasB